MKPNTAPLFRDSARLCDELLRRFEGQPGLLHQRICLHAVVLVEQVGLALARRLPRGAALDAADEALVALVNSILVCRRLDGGDCGPMTAGGCGFGCHWSCHPF